MPGTTRRTLRTAAAGPGLAHTARGDDGGPKLGANLTLTHRSTAYSRRSARRHIGQAAMRGPLRAGCSHCLARLPTGHSPPWCRPSSPPQARQLLGPDKLLVVGLAPGRCAASSSSGARAWPCCSALPAPLTHRTTRHRQRPGMASRPGRRSGTSSAAGRATPAHDEAVGQQPSPHVLHFDRFAIEVCRCGYSRSGSLVADLASGGTELVEVRREQPLKASRITSALQAQRLTLGGRGLGDLLVSRGLSGGLVDVATFTAGSRSGLPLFGKVVGLHAHRERH